MYRVVARPLEYEIGARPRGRSWAPASSMTGTRGALAGTGAAVASTRAAPGGHRGSVGLRTGASSISSSGDMDRLDQIRSKSRRGAAGVRRIGNNMGVVYARIPGEEYPGRRLRRRAGPGQRQESARVLSETRTTRTRRPPSSASSRWSCSSRSCSRSCSSPTTSTRARCTCSAREALALAQGKSDQLLPSNFPWACIARSPRT
jgi:hypothetical protein